MVFPDIAPQWWTGTCRAPGWEGWGKHRKWPFLIPALLLFTPPCAGEAPQMEWLQSCVDLLALPSWGETSGHQIMLYIINMMYLSWPGNGCPLPSTTRWGILQEFLRKLGSGINRKGKKLFYYCEKTRIWLPTAQMMGILGCSIKPQFGFIQKKPMARSKTLFSWGISRPLHVPAAQRSWGCPGPCAGVCRHIGHVLERLDLYLHQLRKKWSPGQPGRFQKH